MKTVFSRKGFTLVELCIVMAIAAMVGTMVVTFSIFAFNRQSAITSEADRIAETTEVQKAVDAWTKKYDSTSYTIAPKETDHTQLVAKNAAGATVGTLLLSNKKITADDVPKTEELTDIASIVFERPTYTKKENTIDIVKSEQMVEMTVTYVNGDEQVLLLPLFSDLTRTRKVEGR